MSWGRRKLCRWWHQQSSYITNTRKGFSLFTSLEKNDTLICQINGFTWRTYTATLVISFTIIIFYLLLLLVYPVFHLHVRSMNSRTMSVLFNNICDHHSVKWYVSGIWAWRQGNKDVLYHFRIHDHPTYCKNVLSDFTKMATQKACSSHGHSEYVTHGSIPLKRTKYWMACAH